MDNSEKLKSYAACKTQFLHGSDHMLNKMISDRIVDFVVTDKQLSAINHTNRSTVYVISQTYSTISCNTWCL